MASQALAAGNPARAIKLLKKSLHLHPLPGVEGLLQVAKREMEEGVGAGGGSAPAPTPAPASNSRPAAARTASSASAGSGAGGRSYTPQQLQIVKEVLASKEGGRGAHYRVLGVQTDADDSQIKKAYRKRALKLHPDKNSAPQSDEAFKAVGLAYATLSDPQKRTIYDRYGEEDPDNRGGGGGGMRPGNFRHGGQEVNPEDIFNMFFGGQAGGMGGGMGGPGFRVYSSGFGPGFAFNGGGFGQQPRRRQQQQQQQEDTSPFSRIAQFLPLLMIFLVSFFSGSSDNGTTGRYFSLTQTPPYINPLMTKLTPVKDIPYFVTDQFMRTYRRDRYQLAQIERMVEKSYRTYLEGECRNQKVYKGQLERNAKDERKTYTPEERARHLKRAEEFELSRCIEFESLFPPIQQRHYAR